MNNNKKQLKAIGIVESILFFILGGLVISLPFIAITNINGETITNLLKLSGYIFGGFIALNGLVMLLIEYIKNNKINALFLVGCSLLSLGLIFLVLTSKEINIIVDLFP
ncbi:MAG: hypothetical protein LBR37_02630, partial [Erysipelotrichaceae bacterium]|nr:hypothetical protein [Erysipelotrichaceae bacterium]